MCDRLAELGRPNHARVLRIVSGLLFLEHGTQKFLGFPPGPMAGMGLPFQLMGAYAGIVELVCGLLIAIGLFTRAGRLPRLGHDGGRLLVRPCASPNFFPVNNQGDAAILYCFVFLYLVFAGAGPLSVDAARARRTPPQP